MPSRPELVRVLFDAAMVVVDGVPALDIPQLKRRHAPFRLAEVRIPTCITIPPSFPPAWHGCIERQRGDVIVVVGQRDYDSHMYQFHAAIDAVIQDRKGLVSGPLREMITFDEFNSICRCVE